MISGAIPAGLADAPRVSAALRELIASVNALALSGRSILTELFAGSRPVSAWTHVPDRDAYDRRSAYRWYYHSHPGNGRWPGEHGHFHLFADPNGGERVTHLIAISVGGRGVPLGLIAPNRWVTDEYWQPAPRVQKLLEHFFVSSPRRLSRIHRLLSQLLKAFAPQIRAVLRHRDQRLAQLTRSAASNVLEDRRIAVLSRCPIDIFRQAAMLDRCLLTTRPFSRRPTS